MLLLLCPVLLETYMNVSSFQKYKQTGHSISMVTCYDHWSAKILNKSDIDCLLVGDSLAVVMHGFDSTIHATIEMMMMHVAAVARGATEKFIIADMPFLSCSKGLAPAMDAVQQLMHAGAHAVKIEGASHQLLHSIHRRFKAFAAAKKRHVSDDKFFGRTSRYCGGMHHHHFDGRVYRRVETMHDHCE